MTDNNQQYKWRQRKQRNTRLGIWIVVVILVSVGGTFAYEGLRDSDPQRVAEEYVKKATGVESFTVEAGDRSLNADNQFVQDYTFTYTVDGKVYAVAKDTDSYAVFYNKALFDQAGVPYPDDSWTIADFCETAKKMTSDGVVGWTSSTSDRVWYNFIWSNGGQI